MPPRLKKIGRFQIADSANTGALQAASFAKSRAIKYLNALGAGEQNKAPASQNPALNRGSPNLKLEVYFREERIIQEVCF